MANYSEYRDNIKSGDLLMWERRSISSLTDIFLMLVQKILNTKYSHVGIAIFTGNRLMVLEADVPKVMLTPLSTATDFYHLPLGIDWKPEHKAFLFKELGKKYSLIDALSYLFKIKRNNKTWYCSQLAAYFYDAVGYMTSDEEGFTPKELTDKLIEISGKTPVFVNIDTANIMAETDELQYP